MRTKSSRLTGVYSAQGWDAAIKVSIYSPTTATWYEMTDHFGFDWVRSVQISSSVDDLSTANVQLITYQADAPELTSLSSFVVSLANIAGTLIQPFNPIKIYAATVPDSGTPLAADYALIFDGRISIIEMDRDHIALKCRTEVGVLQDRIIEVEKEYGTIAGGSSVLVETVMQSILDDHYNNLVLYTAGAVPTRSIDLYSVNGTSGTPFNAGDSPAWAIKLYRQSRTSVWEALKVLSDQIGYRLSWRYHEGSGINGFVLVLESPDRVSSVVPDHTFVEGQVMSHDGITLDISKVRNVAMLRYTDSSEGQTFLAPIEDITSIQAYGRRTHEIALESTSQIDTATEAQALQNAMLEDCRDAAVDVEVTVPYFEVIEVGDRIGFPGDGILIDDDYVLTVMDFTHSFSEKGAMTTLTLNGTIQRSSLEKWPDTQERHFYAQADTNRIIRGRALMQYIPNLLPNGCGKSFGKG